MAFLTIEEFSLSNIRPSSPVLTGHIAAAIKLYSLIPEDEGAVMLESLKKILGGSLGKNLTEYGFPNEEYAEDGADFCR